MVKNIETRKDEVRVVTADPHEMLNKYLSKKVLKTWVEDFVDQDTGEVVNIERNEVVFPSGKLIDNDLLAKIMFSIQAGEIKEVEVSTQKREAFLNSYSCLVPYMVGAQIAGKNYKFLLYASSVMMANEVAVDYIELSYSGFFRISQIKEFNSCTIIEKTNLKKLVSSPFGFDVLEDEDATEEATKEYYKVEANIVLDESTEYSQLFVVREKDVDTAKDVINDWLSQKFDKEAKERDEPAPDFTTTIKSATIFPCNGTIEKDFSMAYMDINELEQAHHE